eukprot:1192875-Prorocentrum_minimum.AAC.3
MFLTWVEVPCASTPTASSTTSSYIDAHSAIDYIEDDTSAMGRRHGRSASSSAVGTLHPYALSKGCTSPNDSSSSINSSSSGPTVSMQ